MENRESTRKTWLIITIAQAALNVVLNLILFLLLIPEALDILHLSIFAIVSLLTYVIPTYILYHCAYKKYGTGLLTFILLISPIGFIKYLIDEIEGLRLSFSTLDSTLLTLSLFAFLMNVILGLLWFWFSLKLRKVNKEVQLERELQKVQVKLPEAAEQ